MCGICLFNMCTDFRDISGPMPDGSPMEIITGFLMACPGGFNVTGER
jgi:hypothetical protein